MNAVLRIEREAPVLTNEAIEVHLSYLRPAVEAIQAELPELRQMIQALDEKERDANNSTARSTPRALN